MKLIRSLLPCGHIFEIRPKYVHQLVPTAPGLTILITNRGSRFVLSDGIVDILKQATKQFVWDATSQTFIHRT